MQPNQTTSDFENANITDEMHTSYTCGPSGIYPCPVFIACSVIFVAGFLGNVFSIIVLSAKKEYREKATFVSINMLCVCDLLALTVTYVVDMFIGPEYWAESYISTLQCTAAIAVGMTPFLLSCYSVCMLALVRYSLVAYPLKVGILRSRKVIILLHVAGAAVIATVLAFLVRISLNTMSCFEAFNQNGYLAYTHPPAILGTVVLLFTLHALKVRRLHRCMSARTYNTKLSIRRVNIIIYIIMCMFIVCQTPFIICDVLQLLVDYGVVVLSYRSFEILYSVGIVFYVLNHAVNPYIYFISYLCFKRSHQQDHDASLFNRSSQRSVVSGGSITD